MSAQPEAKPWPITDLAEIGERLRTQDNRCTADAMFCVQVLERHHGYDTDWSDDHVWMFDGDEVPEGNPRAQKIGYRDAWRTVMVAFTEAGAQDYIRQNGHNHRGEKRIYVESFRRCEEMIAIRKYLMSLPKP